MRRILFNILAIFSLLLCLGVVVSWVRSYFVADSFTSFDAYMVKRDGEPDGLVQKRLLILEYTRGKVLATCVRENSKPVGSEKAPYWRLKPLFLKSHFAPYEPIRGHGGVGHGLWNRGGFFAWHGTIPRVQFARTELWVIGAPHWLLAIVFAVPPAVLLNRARRRHRRNTRGLCPTCGYDLRAHKPGDRCPECGTTIPERAPSTP